MLEEEQQEELELRRDENEESSKPETACEQVRASTCAKVRE